MKDSYKILLKYSIIFVVVTACVYIFFIIENKSFIQYGDGYRQGYFWTVELKNNIQALFSGNGFTLWSWSRGLGGELGLPVDPFNIIAALFPVGYTELGYTIAIILRIYCSGIAFILFGREMNLSEFKVVTGSICYAFSGWIVSIGLLQANFLINTVIFPLVILGVERIYKNKSPLVFVLSVAYFLIRHLYFAYMAAIMTVIYVLIRYFAYNNRLEVKKYISDISKFIAYGLIGVLISAIALVPSFFSISGASTEAATEYDGILYPIDYYLYVLTKIMAGRFDGSGGYAYLGIVALLLMIIPIGYKKMSLSKTPQIMVLICLIMFLLPFFGSMFNGFSYCTGRWTFMFVFFLIWSAIEYLELDVLRNKGNILIMAVSICIMAIGTIGLQLIGLIDNPTRISAFIIVNLLGAVFGLITANLDIACLKHRRNKEFVIFATIVLTIIASWNLLFIGNISKFLKFNEINSQLETSTQRVGDKINDSDFYRIDQVSGICVNKVVSKPANETLWWKTKSIYTYDSKLPALYSDFNKLLGNNCGYTERVATFSNDNRMGLDFITGVKYFLGNDINNEDETSQYAGYGFEYNESIDGVEIYKNKYDVGLGYVYNKYINKSEFEKLSRLEREQALMQAVVVDDEYESEKLQQMSASDINCSVNKIKYEIVDLDGIRFEGKTIISEKEGASFTIHVEDVNNSQLFISFDNLMLYSSSRPEGGAFEILCENDYLIKKAYNKLGNQGFTDIYDYDINMGYVDNYQDDIVIKLSKAGTYSYDDFNVFAMDVNILDEGALKLIDSRYNVTEHTNKYVCGNIESEHSGILFLSLFDNKNWDVYIDGEKAKKLLPVNVAFTGVEIDAGKHEVELKYNYKYVKLGGIGTLIGIIALIVLCVCLWYNKRERQGEL